MVATNGALISMPSESKYIYTTGAAPPGGLEGSSAIWFAVTIIIFIIVIFVFVLLICIRSQRFKEGKIDKRFFYILILDEKY